MKLRSPVWIVTLRCIFLILFFCIGVINAAEAAATLSNEQREFYNQSFLNEPVEEKSFNHFLKTSLRDNEYVVVSVGLLPLNDSIGTPVRVSEYSFEDLFVKHQPQQQWSSVVSSGEYWNIAQDTLTTKAEFLEQITSTGYLTADGIVYAEITLLYHAPHQRLLELGSGEYILSEKAQKYLTISEVSDYPSLRKILIIQEPHYETDRQYALFKGLEIFYRDNPQLLMEGRAVFLAEGYPAGENLSIQPLVVAEPNPNDSLISDILNKLLIPGYVAYEWKHQKGIPIVGIEDPVLYRISASVWSELEKDKDNIHFLLWPHTVSARNQSMVRTLLTQLKDHECPILFVGGKHLEPLTEAEQLRKRDWESFKSILDASDLNYLRQSDTRSIAEFLKKEGIGFYFLSARGSPVPDVETEGQIVEQYAELMRVQLNDNNQENYLRYFGNSGDSVTTAPSVQAAAQAAVMMAKSSSGSNAQTKGGGGDGDDGGGGWISKLKNALKNLLDKIGGKGQGRNSAMSHTDEQQGIVRAAKDAKRQGGLRDKEARDLVDKANKAGLPSHGPEEHPNRPHGKNPHIHVGPVDHIPVKE